MTMPMRKACPTRLHASAACNLQPTQGCVRQDMILPHKLYAAHLIRPLIVQQLATEVVAHNLVLLDLHTAFTISNNLPCCDELGRAHARQWGDVAAIAIHPR